ncbi:MAG: hypothetical protein ACKPKO_25030, partial [Candidatus Fonsibacter sp.]
MYGYMVRHRRYKGRNAGNPDAEVDAEEDQYLGAQGQFDTVYLQLTRATDEFCVVMSDAPFGTPMSCWSAQDVLQRITMPNQPVNKKLCPATVRHHSVLSLLARDKRFPWTSVDLSNKWAPWQSLGLGDGLWT